MSSCTATIIACGHDYVELRLADARSCPGCADAGGCGIGPLLDALQPARRTLWLPRVRGDRHRPGETVQIYLPAGSLLRAAGIAYALPLAAGITGACLASWLPTPGSADAWTAAGALLGATVAWLYGKRLAGRLALPRLIPSREGCAEPA